MIVKETCYKTVYHFYYRKKVSAWLINLNSHIPHDRIYRTKYSIAYLISVSPSYYIFKGLKYAFNKSTWQGFKRKVPNTEV